MALIKHHKYVAALPATLEANAIYYVRVGDGFDLYVTNSNGQVVAYPANSKWDALKAPAIATGVLTIDLATPAGFRVALNQNVTSLSFANVPAGRVIVFTITWVQDATGGRTVAFPASVKADGGGAPVQPAAGANAVTVQSFYTDDGGATVWQAGQTKGPEYYRSSPRDWVVGGSLTFNHGLTGEPRFIQLEAICTVATGSTPIGKRFLFGGQIVNAGTYKQGQVVGYSETEIEVRMGDQMYRLVGASSSDIFTPSNSKIIVSAWR